MFLHPVEQAFQNLPQLVNCCHIDRRLHQRDNAHFLTIKKRVKACFWNFGQKNLLLEVFLRSVRPGRGCHCKGDDLQPCGLLRWRVGILSTRWEPTSNPFLAIHRSKMASTMDVSLLDVHTIVENSPTCTRLETFNCAKIYLQPDPPPQVQMENSIFCC